MPELHRNLLHQPKIKADRVKSSLLSAPYVYAKTMPESPHWYTLRKNWSDDAAFVEAVEFIREFGYVERYKGRPYTMFNLNGYKYWTMGAPIDKPDGDWCTILINKAKIAELADFDEIAESYDSLFADDESEKENRQIMRLISLDRNARVLDIGCGTGLLLSYWKEINYLGIDPSAQMLGQLVTRFPEYRGNICHGRIEEFFDADGFDLTVSLFGAMNYADPVSLPEIMSMLRPGGRSFMMFYQDGYKPVTYEKCGVNFSHHATSEYDLSGFDISKHRDTFLIAEFKRGLREI